MERVYKCALIIVLIVLLGWGVWYIYSYYNEQGSKDGGTLVYVEKEADYGTGNGKY